MSKQNARLLNAADLLDIYGIPTLNDAERREYFTFNEQEIKTLKSFKTIENAVYFGVALVFFKIKQTLVDFSYQDITLERRHIMERYFPNRASPKSPVKDHKVIARIENKVLALRGFKRFSGDIVNIIKTELYQCAPHHPRQRQLCKALLNLFGDITIGFWIKDNFFLVNGIPGKQLRLRAR